MILSQVSEIQRQFLTASQVFDNSPAYNIASFFRLPPGVNEDRLKDAWTRIRRAHQIFADCNESWEVQELGPDGVDSVFALASDVASEAMGTGVGQRLRSILFRAGTTKFWLLILHHSLTDLFSKNLLAAQVSSAYADPEYQPEVISYSTFVKEERDFLGSPAGIKAGHYWKTKMESGAPILRLPTSSGKPRPFVGSGKRLTWRPSEFQRTRLRALEASDRSTFLSLLTAYVATLARFSGQNRFLVGVPFTNRLKFADAPLMGPTVNILPLNVEIGPESTLEDLYGELRAEMLAGHRHQAYPFLSLAAVDRGLERDPLRPWLLQAGFTMEPPPVLTVEGTPCTGICLDRRGSQMDVFFTWWPDEEGWQGYWEYNDASFSEEDVRGWQRGFDRVLDGLLSSTGAVLTEIDLVDPARSGALSRGPDVEYPLDRTMSSFLRASYESHPGAAALIWEGSTTTYQEFAASVAKIAHALVGCSSKKGRVILMLERSPDMVMAVHGAIHAGHAYTPVGVDWPSDRIASIVEDIEPLAVISQKRLVYQLPSVNCAILWIEDLLATPDVAFPPVNVSPDDAIHILFTSGTTGRPKGVELPHKGLVNRLLWMQDEYQLRVGDRAILKTPYTFDVSGWELLWPLMVGATLVISQEKQHLDPREILSLIDQHNVRIVHFVPSMLTHFLDAVAAPQASSLTDVICSGEALTPAHVARFLETLPQAQLRNLYGPTEASIDVTYWTCGRSDLERGTIPIGRPIANTQVYVLDPAGGLCPPTVKGEVFLGGVGLAKGYWQRPELTQNRFIEHPRFGRLYKTGDWGRYGHDGAIEYMERQDLQVKVRGVRVELGEVEAHIRRLPQVAQVVVEKRVTPAGEGLVAFFVPRPNTQATTKELRNALASELPPALIPEWFLAMEDFPRSENGKVDRKALSQISLAPSQQPTTVILSDAERKVARLWAQVIGEGSWDSETNFFDAGGSSLALIRLRPLVESEFGRQITIAQLFQSPTISAMVRLLSGEETRKSGAVERARKQREIASVQRKVGH